MFGFHLLWQPKISGGGAPVPTKFERRNVCDGGADISLQEAVDLLHELREESSQVQAIMQVAEG